MSSRRRFRRQVKRIAEERICLLWIQAQKVATSDPALARSLIQTAKKVAQKARMKLPREMNRRICKECGTVLIPGQTCRVRVRNNRTGHVTVTCLECGAIRRFIVERQA